MESIKLRKFPYPYQAAIAICSDIDGTSFENFVQIHTFLNTRDDTIFGPGLGLPVGDSFWMYDRPGISNAAFSYFEDLNGKPSSYAPMIRDLIQAGILDVMHSYGNFPAISDFSRKRALVALEELQRHRLQIRVWTNHGGIESVQNIGALSWGKGDIPTHEDNGTSGPFDFYHSDLLVDYGVRFYWDSEASLTSMVGQDAPVRFSEAYWRSPLYTGFKAKMKSIIKGYFSFADLLYYKLQRRHFVPWQPFDFQNSLIQVDQLRDGNILFKFKRYGHGKLDWSDDLAFLLNDRVIEHLLRKQGYLIVYIHLGDQQDKSNRLPLPATTVAKLRQLAELYHSGKIWVQTTSRLLNYNFVHKYLKWSAIQSDTGYRINIPRSLANFPGYELGPDDLSGITFICPADKSVELFLEERKLPCQTHQLSDQQQIIMVPVKPLEWPLS